MQQNQLKMFSRITLFFVIATVLSQCKVNKNIPSKNVVDKIISKEVVVHGNRPNVKGEQPYQPSVKRINDIIHTVLDIRFNYQKQQVIGKATITIKPYFYPVSTLDLDARCFELKRVAMIGKDTLDLKYTYDTSVIHINLGREYQSSETYKIFIDYIAKPNENKQKGSAAISDAKGIYFINPLKTDPEKPREIWTQGETQSNSGWFPTNDVPNEKMTHEIYITADEKDVTLSNGEMIYSRINNDHTHTDYWKQSLPNSPYLVMMAIGEFEIIKDSWRDSVEVNYYVEPAFKPYAKIIFGHTPEMLEFFSTRLGVAYPWDKFSQIVVRDFVSGAMENTSAVVHFEGLNHDAREHLDNTYESIISHELFHHWFGDLVTCESWSNIPLNESFATYGQYLWEEHKYGRMEADNNIEHDLSAYLSQKAKHKTKLIRYNYNNREDMFDVVSYQKGGRVLHMLRKVVGDEAFFKSLQVYLTKNKFKNAEIHNLRLAFEEVTGEDLNWFFNQWFIGSGHPNLVVTSNFDAEKKNVTVTVEQKQDSSFGVFKLPVTIDIYSNGKVKHEHVTIEKKKEVFTFKSEHKIDLVNFDAEKMLLASIKDEKNIDEYFFMFKNAPLFIDKNLAAEGITANRYDSSITDKIYSAVDYAISHEYYGIRDLGLDLIIKMEEKDKTTYAEKMIAILHHDNNSSIRAKAIDILMSIDNKKYTNEFIKAVNDSSYLVVGKALHAISETDPELALKSAEIYKNSKNGTIQSVYSNLVAEYGKGDYVSYFENTFGKYGNYKFGILNAYATYLNYADSTIVLKAIPGLHSYYLSSKESDIYSGMMIKRIITVVSRHYDTIIDTNEEEKKKLKPNDPKIKILNEEIARANSMLEKIRSIALSSEK
jgi:aminopeptidase N